MSPLLRQLRGVWRLAHCVTHIGAGMLRCAVIYPFATPTQRMQQTGRWCAKMARVLGLQIHGSGESHGARDMSQRPASATTASGAHHSSPPALATTCA